MLCRRSVITTMFTIVAVGTTPVATSAGPASDLWLRWQTHDPGATTHVDHGIWTELLSRRLVPGSDGVNYIDYAGWQGSTDHDHLNAYIDHLQSTDVDRLNRAEQFAFWVNLYNAGTIQIVLEHYPVASIRNIDISPGLFANGPWGARQFVVLGETLSLDDMEHRILRPIWRDPRIHYAVNCAAIGCPNLAGRAYTAQGLEEMLERNARAFINDPRAIEKIGGDLIVSSIYRWFREDFGNNTRGILTHLRQYANDNTSALLQDARNIDSYRYDWSLNDASLIG